MTTMTKSLKKRKKSLYMNNKKELDSNMAPLTVEKYIKKVTGYRYAGKVYKNKKDAPISDPIPIHEVVPVYKNEQLLSKSHKNHKYEKKWRQLDAIINDKNYWVHDSGYKLFLEKMMKKILLGERITPNMDEAITKAINSYKSFLYPSERSKMRLSMLIDPINKCIDLLQELYSDGHITKNNYWNNFEFMESIKTSAQSYGSLTNKQKLAMNKKYKDLLKIKDIQAQVSHYKSNVGKWKI